VIIDGHVTLSFTADPLAGVQRFSVEDIISRLNQPLAFGDETLTIERAVVGSPARSTAVGSDLEAQHQVISEAVNAYPDRLCGCITLHPMLDGQAVAPAIKRLAKDGFRAVELNPTIHGFLPHRSLGELAPLMRATADLGLPVMVHTGEPPFAFPTPVAYLAEAHPHQSFVLRNLGSQQVTYAREAIYVAERNPNVHLETTWGSTPMLKEALRVLGPERLIFASDMPRQDASVAIAALSALRSPVPLGIALAPLALTRILGDNLAKLLRW
jgi:predicted TIM-barrel fold metal-dependent hydrolase